MTRATFTVLFYIKRTKELANGKAPIFVRVTVNSERCEWSIKKSIKKTLWNKDKCCAQGFSKDAKELNSYLDFVKTSLFFKKRQLEERGTNFTV